MHPKILSSIQSIYDLKIYKALKQLCFFVLINETNIKTTGLKIRHVLSEGQTDTSFKLMQTFDAFRLIFINPESAIPADIDKDTKGLKHFRITAGKWVKPARKDWLLVP